MNHETVKMCFNTPLTQLLLQILLFLNLNSVESSKNNVCPDFLSYYYADYTKKCFYVKDVHYEMGDRLNFYLPRIETHKIVTQDGYILDVFRIRARSHPKGVVILQHPLTVDARIFMTQFNESTALWWYNEGYDTWMPNYRGTHYSQSHVTYTPKQLEFWDFTYHELGYYDQKAIVDYVYEKTNKTKAIFVGHSLSSTAALIYASLRPNEAQEKLKVMVLMATVAYMREMTTPVIYMAPVYEYFLKYLVGVVQVFYPWASLFDTNTQYMKFIIKIGPHLPLKFFLPYAASIFSGWDPNEMDPRFVNMVTPITSATSIKLYGHFCQVLTHSRDFVMFDYGRTKNLILYNQTTPPEYPVEKIKCPIHFVASTNDTFATLGDLETLLAKLSPEAKKYGTTIVPNYNHFDYHIGRHRKEMVWDPVFKFLEGVIQGV